MTPADLRRRTVHLARPPGQRRSRLERRRAARRHHHGERRSPLGGLGGAGQIRPDRDLDDDGIGGIFKANPLIGSYLTGAGFFVSHFNNPLPTAILVRAGPGASDVGKGLTDHLAAYPNLKIQTRAQFQQSQQAQINDLLGLVYVLMALAVVIALIGIVNTLMLSVFERTHELGVLRAVGMKRPAGRAMIRSEAVIIALFGAVTGVIIGTALGVAFAIALKQQGVTEIAIPFAEPDRAPGPIRAARPRCRQLAGSPRRQARRPGGHRNGVRRAYASSSRRRYV